MAKQVANVAKTAVKSVANTATLGLYGAATTNSGNFFDNAAKSFVGGVSGITNAQETIKQGSSVVADLTGATAANQGLQAQIAQSQAEARRQALLSDALAANEGGAAARVSLNTGKNRRSMLQNSTGISGAGSSTGTGIQS